MADSSDLRFKHLRPQLNKIRPASSRPDQQQLDLEPLTPEEPKGRFSRRSFLSGLGATGFLAGAAPLVQAAPSVAPAPADAAAIDGSDAVSLRVNGKEYNLGRTRPPRHAARHSARTHPSHRHEEGLRSRPVRRLHRPHQWPPREQLPDLCGDA